MTISSGIIGSNGFGFQMPESIDVEHHTYTTHYGKFIIQPLESGYGTTLGNAMRRVLLASLPGSAITAIRIDGIQHEFSTIPGVREDVTEIVSNLKGVRVLLLNRRPEKVQIQLKGPCVFTAGDIQKGTTEFEVLNPDHVVATLDDKASFRMELVLARGRGYLSADENRDTEAPLGTIPLDSIYTPVMRVNYKVENTRVGQRIDYEKLILEVWTDGSITPDDALSYAGKLLRDHISLFINFEMKPLMAGEEGESDEESLRIRRLLRKPVDELELSVRSANCLKDARIRTIADLVAREQAEMLKFKNFGRKSLTELEEILVQHGLHFGFNIEKYLGPEARRRIVE